MVKLELSRIFSKLFVGVLVICLLLSACTLAEESNTPPKDTTASPETADPDIEGTKRITLEPDGIASSFITTIVPSADPDTTPYWDKLPEHIVITLDGYPVSDNKLQPKIYIFPLDELVAFNESTAEIIASLQTLLESPGEVAEMPFLPLINETQMMHAQVQSLDFKSGRGLRYLTEFSQGIVPVNNSELFYTYQGISSDGKYYVASVLPVSHPSLPTGNAISGNEPPQFSSDYLGYLASMGEFLNAEAANRFTPNLTQLDSMVRSLEIN